MMIERIVVLMMSLGACASMAQAAIAATGDVNPPDPSTWFMHPFVIIGDGGEASVTVDDDSDLFSPGTSLGVQNGGQGWVTVSGAGSTWFNFSGLAVGVEGAGTLDITNGGAVRNTYCFIAEDIGSRGAVTVSGAGSSWTNSGDLLVGYNGDGELTIADGGLVEVSGYTQVEVEPWSTGAINFDNGTLTTGGFEGAAGVLSGTGTINTNGLATDVDLVFDATHGLAQTLTLNGPGRNITVNLEVDGSAPMSVGYGGEGSMHISDGLAVQSTYGYIGEDSGSTGAVTVSGVGSSWTNSGNLYVGWAGAGTLDITNGGAVSNTEGRIGYYSFSTGAVTVSGAGSTWTNSGDLRVGGTLEITNGGAVSNTEGYVGSQRGSTGAVTVSGAGATWTNSKYLHIGTSSGGTLDITNGGAVSDTYGYIGRESGHTGAVTVSGAGSTWTNSYSVYVGFEADGTLDITNGGAVSDTYGYIGRESGHTGAVTVSGAGAIWTNSYSVYVGFEANGTLDITNGGVVNNTYGYIGRESGSKGEVTVSGAASTWANSGDLHIGHHGDGSLLIDDGGLVIVDGELTIDDDGGGESFINMGGGGMLALFGDADDSLDDFLALIEGTDDILYWNESVWGWVDITSATDGDDYTLSYLTEGYLGGYTMLTVTAATAASMGDTNGDDIVDGLDCANLVAQFGGLPADESADFNGDDSVGLEDFAILRGHFGSGVVSAPGAEFAAVTPEPATMLLLAGGLPVLLRQRRRLSCHPSAPLRTDGG